MFAIDALHPLELIGTGPEREQARITADPECLILVEEERKDPFQSESGTVCRTCIVVGVYGGQETLVGFIVRIIVNQAELAAHPNSALSIGDHAIDATALEKRWNLGQIFKSVESGAIVEDACCIASDPEVAIVRR